ncbi:MAG: response regulator [Desulfomonile sp.]|nr:response regulator [Desulfomonile sp.]
MKKEWKILVVDSDQANARALAGRLKREGHSALVARDLEHALSILEFRAFEVLIVDVSPFSPGGLDLIGWANMACPRPRIVAIGAAIPPETERRALDMGASMVLAKPIDWDRVAASLTPTVNRSAFSGMVKSVDLIEYVQFVLLGGSQTILEVKSALGTTARLYMSDGRVIHAQCGILQGEAALYRCLRFREGTFEHLPWEEPEATTIDKPSDFLLFEAVRQRDDAWGEGALEQN